MATKEERLRDKHTDSRAEFNKVASAYREERENNLADRRFYTITGAMWEGSLGDQYENKLKMEVNKVHQAVIRVIDEYRNNRIDVDFVDKYGNQSGLSEICDDLYRADETDSGGEEAKDNSFEESVGGGIGAWRLRTEYEDDSDPENEHQRIRFEPIYDADSCVYFDLNAQNQSKSDAGRCWVLTRQTVDSYIEEWGDDPATWPKDVYQSEFDWATPNFVWVCEFFEIEYHNDDYVTFVGLDGTEEVYYQSALDDDEELVDRLQATGFKEDRRRTIKKRKCHKYIMSGAGILEDGGLIAGDNIPIIPEYGKRWVIDGLERTMGHVRLIKDIQRLKNMQISKLGEISALNSTEKPILTPEQVGTHGQMWTEDNVKNYPYLLLDPVADANGNRVLPNPPYTRAPQIPPAMAALLAGTEADMQEMLGNQSQGDKMVSNISGDAIELIQTRIDGQAYIYISNFAKSLKRCGEVWLGMAKDVYVEPGRKLKGIDRAGEAYTIELNRPTTDDDGATIYENDLTEATFDVGVTVGPTSNSKKAATVRGLRELLGVTQDPADRQVITAMIMMNTEAEGVQSARDYFRKKLIRMGVEKPNEEEAEELQAEIASQPPTAEEEYLQSEAEKNTAQAGKYEAETVQTVAETENTRADTAKTLSEIPQARQQSSVENISALVEMLREPQPLPAATG